MCRSEEGRATGKDVSLRVITSKIPSLLVVSYFMSSPPQKKQNTHTHTQKAPPPTTKKPKSMSTNTAELGGSTGS